MYHSLFQCTYEHLPGALRSCPVKLPTRNATIVRKISLNINVCHPASYHNNRLQPNHPAGRSDHIHLLPITDLHPIEAPTRLEDLPHRSLRSVSSSCLQSPSLTPVLQPVTTPSGRRATITHLEVPPLLATTHCWSTLPCLSQQPNLRSPLSFLVSPTVWVCHGLLRLLRHTMALLLPFEPLEWLLILMSQTPFGSGIMSNRQKPLWFPSLRPSVTRPQTLSHKNTLKL